MKFIDVVTAFLLSTSLVVAKDSEESLHVDNVPDAISLKTYTLVGPTDVYSCSSYSATNTNSAAQNYQHCYFSACGGTQLSVSSCGSCTGDTYLRLLTSGSLTVGDDGCNDGSNCSFLLFSLPGGSSDCIDIDLREGCYNAGSCSGLVTVTGSYAPSDYPSEIPSEVPTETPSLSLTPSESPSSAAPSVSEAPSEVPTLYPTSFYYYQYLPKPPPVIVRVDDPTDDELKHPELCSNSYGIDPFVGTGGCSLRSAWALLDNMMAVTPRPYPEYYVELPADAIITFGGPGLLLGWNYQLVKLMGNNATIHSDFVRDSYAFQFVMMNVEIHDLHFTNFYDAQLLVMSYMWATTLKMKNVEVSRCTAEADSLISMLTDQSYHQTALIMENCRFSHNEVYASGGDYTTVVKVTMTNVVIRNTTFTHHQGQCLSVVEGDYLTIENSHFTHTRCYLDGCAFSVAKIETVTVTNSLFTDNGALFASTPTNGGSIHASSFANVLIDSCFFAHATFSGDLFVDTTDAWFGGPLLKVVNTVFTQEKIAIQVGHAGHTTQIVNCTFTENEASFLYTSSNSYYSVSIEDCTFDRNSGTAIQITPSGTLVGINAVIQNCEFTNNVGYAGGAMSIGPNAVYVTVKDCHFENNTANNGGAIYMTQSLYSNIESCMFLENSAETITDSVHLVGLGGHGGAIYFDDNNIYIAIRDCWFDTNSVQTQGGALFARQLNVIDVNTSYFLSNTALESGGAIFCYSTNQLIMLGCEFEQNTAGQDGGAILMDNANSFHLESCGLRENLAQKSGGAVALLSGNDLTYFVNVSIIANRATLYGSGVYSLTENNYMVFQDSAIVGNTGASYGGGVFIGLSCSNVNFENTAIQSNTAKFGGGVYVDLLNLFVTFAGSQITENVATVGGGLYLSGSFLIVSGSEFRKNQASLQGGGVFASSVQILTITDTVMELNRAGTSGGGLCVDASSAVSVTDSHFDSNTADTLGGGIFMSSVSTLVLTGVELFGNTVPASGGGVYLDNVAGVRVDGMIAENNTAFIDGGGMFINADTTSISITSSQFLNNHVGAYGGAIASEAESDLTLSECEVDWNIAIFGGGISILNSKQLLLQGTVFSANLASVDGGGLYVAGSDTMTAVIVNCDFTDNVAGNLGGGIEVFAIDTINSSQSKFNGNQAFSGGALHASNTLVHESRNDRYAFNTAYGTDGGAVLLSSVASHFWSAEWENNTATKGGGGLFWTTTSGMVAPTLTDCDMSFNHAAYGADAATEGTHAGIRNGIERVSVDTFSDSVDPIQFYLLDYYDNVVTTQSSTSLSVTVDANKYSCGASGYPVAVGATSVEFKAGVATFDSLQLACNPSGNMSLEVSYTGESHDVTLPVSVVFRSCQRGEYYSNNKCVMCPAGTYSLENNTDNHVTSCNDCPHGVKSCQGDELTIASGYWRISSEAHTPLACPYPTGCNQTTHAGDAICLLGFEGPLCAVCSENYYYDSTSNACKYCQAGEMSLFAKVVLSLLVIVIAIFLFLLWFIRHHVSHDEAQGAIEMSMTDAALTLSVKVVEIFSAKHGFKEAFQKNKKKWKRFASRMQSKFKIYVTLYQIISGLPYVLNLKYPSIFTKMTNVFQFANFNFTQNLGLECRFKYDYVDLLLVSTIGPAIAIVALFTVQWVHINVMSHTIKPESLPKIKANYFFAFLVFTYLILPGVSTNIFRTFSRENVDPDGATGNYEWYMTSDYRIRTNSSRYRFAAIWAGVMILVYPIGVPAYYYYVLYQAKEQIKTRPEEKEQEELEDAEDELAAEEAASAMGEEEHPEKHSGEGGVELVEKKREEEAQGEAPHDQVVVFSADVVGPVKEELVPLSARSKDYAAGFSGRPEAPAAAAAAAAVDPKKEKTEHEMAEDLEALHNRELLRPLKFLFQAYEPAFWYWEVVETVQRLLLTGVLVLIVQGSALQIVIAITVSVIFTKLYGLYKPYIHDDDDFEKEMTQWQIFTAFFLALLIKTNALAEFNGIISVGLVLSSTANLFVDFFSQLKEIWDSLGVSELVGRFVCLGARFFAKSRRIAVTTTEMEGQTNDDHPV